MDKNSLLYWFPKLSNLSILMPKTVIVPIDRKRVQRVFDGEQLPGKIEHALHAAAKELGYPLFLRTDLCSAKHNWKNSCYVPNQSELIRHMISVCEYNECSGLFGMDYTAIILREFMLMESSFTAFNEFPVNKERRYFVLGGEVLCHHPYWPEEAIEGHTKDSDWKTKLAALNVEDESEVLLLSKYAEMVSIAVEGCWSVDFTKTKNGHWCLIDMALGAASYHWPGCSNYDKIQDAAANKDESGMNDSEKLKVYDKLREAHKSIRAIYDECLLDSANDQESPVVDAVNTLLYLAESVFGKMS